MLNFLEESQSRVIDLKDVEPDIIDHVMSFFYSLDYDDNLRDSSSSTSKKSLMSNALVYAAGDMLGIPELKDLAVVKTLRIFQRTSTPCNLAEFSEALRTVWTSTPSSDKSLRKVFLDEFSKRRIEIEQTVGDEKAKILTNLRSALDFYEDFTFRKET